MQEIRLLEIYNPYPQGVLLDLEARPIDAPHHFHLTLSLNCQEQPLALLAGRIKFGFKAGRVKLQIKGGHFEVLAPLPHSHSASSSVWCWPLESSQGQPLWKGFNERWTLGCLNTGGLASHLLASFEVALEEITITEAEGIWKPDGNPNQLAVSERLLAHFLAQHLLPPSLSGVQIALGDLSPWEDLFSELEPQPDPIVFQQLGQTLQTLHQHPQADLPTLVNLAGLDLQNHCAGGKFLGATLTGISWSGSNLRRCNFRGAILTDADLSEADARGSNFGGADLSGAYLEGANLQRCDFHKSSLALANLIGANLTQANLVGTALNQVNLSGAIVSQAQFGDNPGLTLALKQSLQARGAIFLDESNEKML